MNSVIQDVVDELQRRAERDYGDEYTTKILHWNDGGWSVEVFHTYDYMVAYALGKTHRRYWRDGWYVTTNDYPNHRRVQEKFEGQTWGEVDSVEIDVEVKSVE